MNDSVLGVLTIDIRNPSLWCSLDGDRSDQPYSSQAQACECVVMCNRDFCGDDCCEDLNGTFVYSVGLGVFSFDAPTDTINFEGLRFDSREIFGYSSNRRRHRR